MNELTMNLEELKAVEKFAATVGKYCRWAENPSSDDPVSQLQFARQVLSELHLDILKLPEVELTSERAFSPEVNNWKEILQRFSILPVDGYWDVFDPLKEDEPVFNSLADDLSDIYRDLIEGLYFYDRNELTEAVWEWKFYFNIHWGAHLVGAQRAIHSYLSEIES